MTQEQTLGSINIPAHDYNSLNLRINPEKELKEIEAFLKGERIEWVENDKGDIVKNSIKVGIRQCDPNHVATILSCVSSCLNTATVQGNFTTDRSGYCQAYEDFKENFRKDLAEALIINIYDFGISDEKFDTIMFIICNRVEPFMTRLIDNLERDGLTKSVKSIETNKTNEPERRGLFS